ncbi:MAG TPA: sulfatase [Terriglobales bacterium]
MTSWALHVSPPILGISTVVDVGLFCLLALATAGIARIFTKVSAVRATTVLLVGLTTYDWLTLTARLSSRSRILLALGVAIAFRRWFLTHEQAILSFWRRSLPWAATVAACVLVGIPIAGRVKEHQALAALPTAAKGSPNILVIVVDTLRADHLSAYGYGRPTSPEIDRLAREGVLFENAVAPCSWTYPSHVSLITGRYIYEHRSGRPEQIPLLGPEKGNFGGYPTIGEALEQRGYRTGAFSANRFFFNSNLGFGRSFIHFEDYYNSFGDMFYRTLAGKEAMRLYGKTFKKRLSADWLQYGTNYGIRKRADEVNDEVLHWIDRGGPHPFFAFLNYLDVHDPYQPPPAYPRLAAGANAVDAYDNGVRYTDDYIGRLMRALADRGLDKNTLVILTSDHGEMLGEHGHKGHGRMLYWHLLHVPLIFWYPGHVPSGVRIPRPVSNVALAATVLDLLGADSAQNFRGPALDLLWRQPKSAETWPDPISELAENAKIFNNNPELEAKVATAQDGPLKSLVTPRWHLIIHKKFGGQLYDWTHDPAELNNLLATPAGRETARDLIAEMNGMLSGKRGDGSPEVLRAGSFRGPHRGHYYRLQAHAGAQVEVEVDSTPATQMDPMLSLEDATGKLLESCNDPADDHVRRPGTADSTPDAFDDLCVNDDLSPGESRNSRLQILVPQGPAPVDLYVKVSDWNGAVPENADYQITINMDEKQ